MRHLELERRPPRHFLRCPSDDETSDWRCASAASAASAAADRSSGGASASASASSRMTGPAACACPEAEANTPSVPRSAHSAPGSEQGKKPASVLRHGRLAAPALEPAAASGPPAAASAAAALAVCHALCTCLAPAMPCKPGLRTAGAGAGADCRVHPQAEAHSQERHPSATAVCSTCLTSARAHTGGARLSKSTTPACGDRLRPRSSTGPPHTRGGVSLHRRYRRTSASIGPTLSSPRPAPTT